MRAASVSILISASSDMLKHPPRPFLMLTAGLSLLSGCAATVYTVDDGSPVDETLLADIRTYGRGQQLLRPNIVRTAQLRDKDCSTQYELPFAVASSYDLPKMKKIAWVRGLGVDERLTVIAAAPDAGLALGDHIEAVGGYKRDNSAKMIEELISLRDDGRPFSVKLAGGKSVPVTPVEVCRGHVDLAAPEAQLPQEYHWLHSTHPLSLFTQDVTPDEAMWMVLWTQGLSEEAGARMKFYHYGLKLVKTGIAVASIASGVGAVANAANTAAAATAAASAQAGRAATQAALQAAAKAAAEQAASTLRQKALDSLQTLAKGQLQEIALDSLKAATIFKDSLSGVSWVAGTGFYMADKWAIERMAKLDIDPLAAYTLHYKLAANALTQNAFVFDEERIKLMAGFSEKYGIADKVKLVLSGQDPNAPMAVIPEDPALAAAAAVAGIRVAVGDTVFEGAFVLDQDRATYSGNGKVSWAHGDVYTGELKAGRRTGFGRMEWANGQSYEGDWSDDAATGIGKLRFQNGDRYEGAVAAGVRQGVGSMQFASGDHYEGEFAANVPHGQGSYRWVNGDRYEGEWKANLRHGKGTFIWNSGDRWAGTFQDGAQTEDGVLTRHAGTPAGDDGQKTADASWQ